MTIDPTTLTSSELWKSLEVDRFFVMNSDGDIHPKEVTPEEAYVPNSLPEMILCRISDSTKRLGEHLTISVVEEDWWGKVYHLSGTGSPVGILLALNQDRFSSADYMPDGIHVFGKEKDPKGATILRQGYDFKSFRVFPIEVGGIGHGLMVTVKNRWFRDRNDPKHLGYSKEAKT